MVSIQKIDYRTFLLNHEIEFSDYENHYYFSVSENGNIIGCFISYGNEYHANHTYIYPQLYFIDSIDYLETFKAIQKYFGKPLQVMIESTNESIISLLIEAGFTCKRKCYDREFKKQDLIDRTISRINIELIDDQNHLYTQAVDLAFLHYVDTHKDVNPFTADLQTFKDLLPQKVYCQLTNGMITNNVFVENNELCYVGSKNLSMFEDFCHSVLNKMFEKHETIMFESDTTDLIAMKFKSCFNDDRTDSYDTYILSNH